MMELGKPHLATMIIIIDSSGKNYERMLKPVGESLMRNRYLIISKYFPQYLLTTYKLINIKSLLIQLTEEKPGKQHFNQVIKVNFFSNGTNQDPIPPDMMS